jgi:hypothetical protein
MPAAMAALLPTHATEQIATDSELAAIRAKRMAQLQGAGGGGGMPMGMPGKRCGSALCCCCARAAQLRAAPARHVGLCCAARATGH